MKLHNMIGAGLLAMTIAGFAGTAGAAVQSNDTAHGLRMHQALTANVALLGMEHAIKAESEKPVQLARRGRRRAFGTGLAVGIIGALIAQGMSESEARSRYEEEWRWERCAEEFRSFEWDTGMYTTFGGDRRLCPYLR